MMPDGNTGYRRQAMPITLGFNTLSITWRQKGWPALCAPKGLLLPKPMGKGKSVKRLSKPDCLTVVFVNLSAKLFLNTQIPASLWFVRRKGAEPYHHRHNKNDKSTKMFPVSVNPFRLMKSEKKITC